MTQSAHPSVLVVDGDILSRHAISDYLRHCGYAVVEAANTDEATTALGDETLQVDIILCDVGATGAQSGSELVNWVKAHRPELEVRLAGNLAGTADAAADLCESGPELATPYEPQSVVDYITRLRASRKPASA